MSDLNHIPEGYHSVTPSLTVSNADAAMNFYAAAFGAVELFRMPDEKAGKLMHAEFRIGNSTVMISDEYPEMGAVAPKTGRGGAFMIYVADVEATYESALKAGATQITPVEDMFWGDRVGRVADPYGYRWSIAQKIREVTPEEITKGAEEFSG